VTVLVGGAFLRYPLWLRARLALMFLGVRLRRRARVRQGLPVESRLTW
jgi:hypothetical protein